MHTLQKLLIKRLVEENGRLFSSLTRGYDAEDNIVFHLKRLVADGLVEKHSDKYFITAKGLTALSSFQKTDLKDNVFKKFFAGFVCNCGDDFLIKSHENHQQTFYNLPSGSPLFGESLEDALPRIFNDETGLQIPYTDFTFDSLHMKTVITESGTTIFDDAFGVYKTSITADQKAKMELKKCIWLNGKEVAKLSNKWPEIDICVLNINWKPYCTYAVKSDYVLRKQYN